MSECFIITRNKMKVASGDSLYYYSQNSIFEDGQKFYRKTWWNTWGRKVVFILCIIGFIMVFSDDIIRLVTGNKNYESKNEIIKNIREDVRDPMVRHLTMKSCAKWQNFLRKKNTYANAGISTRFLTVSPAAMISLP